MQKDELLEMTGSVEQIIFRNEKKAYASFLMTSLPL